MKNFKKIAVFSALGLGAVVSSLPIFSGNADAAVIEVKPVVAPLAGNTIKGNNFVPTVAPHVHPEVKPEIEPEVKPFVAPQVKPQLADIVHPEVKPEVTPKVASK